MSNPQPNDYPGANAMGDTLAFVKQLWGSMKIPGMSIPSLSPEDIDKQIADLKAVESWLQVNMNMLRSSIQALEVQSATLNALRSVSESFAKAAAGTTGATTPADDKPVFESPFQSAFQSAFESPFQSSTQTQSPSASESSAAASGTADPAAMAAPFANAAVWWNAMQEQFSNAVSQAMQQSTPAEPKPSKKAATDKATTNQTSPGKTASTKTASSKAASSKTTASKTTTAKSTNSTKRKKSVASQRAAKPAKKDTPWPASGG